MRILEMRMLHNSPPPAAPEAAMRRQSGDVRPSRRWAAGLALFAVVTAGAGALYLWRGKQSPVIAAAPAPVIVAQVQKTNVPIIREGLGTVQALYTATIRTQVEGLLESVNFTEGQTVKKGDELAQIDPRPFQAALDQAIGTLSRDQAHLTNAEANLNRYVPLASHGYASQQQTDTQKAMVAQLKSTIRVDQAAIEGAQTQLSYTRIVAPFDGVTGLRLIDPGNIVHPNDPTGLVVVTQVQPITIVFSLPAADLPDVEAALARGEVESIAYAPDDKTEIDRGRLMLINNEADPTTGTVRLKAMFPNAARKLWPGTFVNVHVVTQTRSDAATVPTSAIEQGPNEPFVYVVGSDGVAHLRAVDVAQSRDGRAVVSKGLQPDETVVASGQYGLTDGKKVEPVSGQDAAMVKTSSTGSEGMLP
jgi:multidrug efflux system membrane fusion protein